MTAFRIIPTVKLFNLAKKKRYDGYGSNSVYITVRTKRSHELIEIYRDIKSVFNNGKDMTWDQLFNLMDNQLSDSLVVFELL
ncbi:DUF1031 domain-containing protein [Lactococcus lactis]|uniref:DUF1031 domain-containing protein n=2 Tax=Lactococcus lactis TaxID=1358 RepID=A0A6B3SE33_9LACT|nr:DUF1031 domain-containing protein [Lactococcus lactis]MCT1195499.1 DUF1031 domain-containing protein [Lactococcus lactis]NEX51224.1 DUF1031 domain-containing protein [Lactococcus lactis]NEX53332.1 DUF1031 domain-containing protein [Lactococcus lactis]NEX55338.1 DUF1031 domain-containing protein [Lactococcus lactis]